MKEFKIANAVLFWMVIIMLFGNATILVYTGNYFSKEKYTVRDVVTRYEKGETIVTDVTKVERVEIQRNLTIPDVFEFETTDTLILLDKSGSMEKSVNEFYWENFALFQQGYDMAFFNTDVQMCTDINAVEFGGNTDVINAINIASSNGYKNIMLFSDMEQTITETKLNVGEDKELQIYIISPKRITDYSAINQLKDCSGVKSIKMIQRD